MERVLRKVRGEERRSLEASDKSSPQLGVSTPTPPTQAYPFILTFDNTPFYPIADCFSSIALFRFIVTRVARFTRHDSRHVLQSFAIAVNISAAVPASLNISWHIMSPRLKQA